MCEVGRLLAGKRTYNLAEAAKLLGCTRQRVHQMVLSGELRAERGQGKRKTCAIPREAILDLLIEREAKVLRKEAHEIAEALRREERSRRIERREQEQGDEFARKMEGRQQAYWEKYGRPSEPLTEAQIEARKEKRRAQYRMSAYRHYERRKEYAREYARRRRQEQGAQEDAIAS
jgi:excisionase family DNA binding protein